MKLWIDDLRMAPDESWAMARNSAYAISQIELYGSQGVVYDEISFDHDLGGDDTTRPVVLFLCENPQYWPKTCRVHSANPVGVDWLTGIINRYGPGVTK